MTKPQSIGFRCPECGATRPNPEGTVVDPAGGFRAVTLTVTEKVCDACRVGHEPECASWIPGGECSCPTGRAATATGNPPEFNPAAAVLCDESCRYSDAGAQRELVRLVAERVIPPVTLAFEHQQHDQPALAGNLNITTWCSGCRTDLGAVLRGVPLQDIIVTPTVLQDIAERIAERVNERHCEVLAATRSSAGELPGGIVEMVDAFGAASSDTGGRMLTAADERDACRRQADARSALKRRTTSRPAANIAADRVQLEAEIRATWQATRDEQARRMERPLAEVVAGIRADRDGLAAELADRRRDEQVDRDTEVRRARELVRLANDERDLAIREYRALRDAGVGSAEAELRQQIDVLTSKLKGYQEAAASLGRDLVERNLEFGRASEVFIAWAHRRRDNLAERARAIGATLAGPSANEGVIDAAGVWHDLADSAPEVDAIEAILSKLESDRIMTLVDQHGAACAEAAVAAAELGGQAQAAAAAAATAVRSAVRSAVDFALTPRSTGVRYG